MPDSFDPTMDFDLQMFRFLREQDMFLECLREEGRMKEKQEKKSLIDGMGEYEVVQMIKYLKATGAPKSQLRQYEVRLDNIQDAKTGRRKLKMDNVAKAQDEAVKMIARGGK